MFLVFAYIPKFNSKASECQELKSKLEKLELEQEVGPAFCKVAEEVTQIAQMLFDALPEELVASQERQRKRWCQTTYEAVKTMQERLEDEPVSFVEDPELHKVDGWKLDPEAGGRGGPPSNAANCS